MAENRFASASNQEIDFLADTATNDNTKRSTSTWMNVFNSWAKCRGIQKSIESFDDPCELDRVLCMFFCRNKETEWSRLRT